MVVINISRAKTAVLALLVRKRTHTLPANARWRQPPLPYLRPHLCPRQLQRLLFGRCRAALHLQRHFPRNSVLSRCWRHALWPCSSSFCDHGCVVPWDSRNLSSWRERTRIEPEWAVAGRGRSSTAREARFAATILVCCSANRIASVRQHMQSLLDGAKLSPSQLKVCSLVTGFSCNSHHRRRSSSNTTCCCCLCCPNLD